MKASVLINTYNHGPLLEEAVESALHQTVPENSYELIVVDDGSNDGTGERMKKYGDRIVYLYQENAGQAAAMNTAIRHARGEVLVFLDGDDRMKPGRLEKVIAAFQDPEVAIVLNSRILFSEDGSIAPAECFKSETLIPSRANLASYFRVTYGTSRMAIRAGLVNQLFPIPEGFPINADVYLMALCWFGKLATIGESLTEYRVHAGNLFHSGTGSALDMRIASLEFYLQAYRERARLGKYYDPKLLEDFSFFYDYSIHELRHQKLLLENKAGRMALLKNGIREWKRFSFDWSPVMKLKHLIKLSLKVMVGGKRIVQIRKIGVMSE